MSGQLLCYYIISGSRTSVPFRIDPDSATLKIRFNLKTKPFPCRYRADRHGLGLAFEIPATNSLNA